MDLALSVTKRFPLDRGAGETPRSEEPDGALLEAARAGDARAFGLLHERYARLVHGILLNTVPPRDAEDLLQEVFLQAWRSLGTLRDPGAFGGWLVRIAKNRAHDYHRSDRPLDPLTGEEAAARGDTTEAEALFALEAVRSLPEAYSVTLTLRLVEGMTGPEIAARTGLTPDSVRVNLHRGFRMLRERLGGRTARER